jgi:EmrB/QacA subfamily drug resistance transporter
VTNDIASKSDNPTRPGAGNGETLASNAQRLSLILTGLLLAIFVSAIDNTVVSTAMGTIVASLGGFDQFVWVTAAYMATETAGMPIFGKLSDMYGRKRFFLFGLGLFVLASMLCGTAHSMWQLALYRALQGIGGGALMPVAFTIIFDVVPPERAGRFSGMFGAVFGAASIIGPLLGAYITEHFSWRWVFFINLPLGIISWLLVGLAYRESHRHVHQAVDWAGTATLVPAAGSLMFALQLGGQKYAWSSPVIITLLCAAAVLFALFLWVEARAEAPIVSYAMFRERLFAVSNLVGLFSAAAFVVAVVYIPIYVQGVRGGDASNAGLTLLPMMLGSSISAPIGGQLCQRAGYRNILLVSGTVFTAALGMLMALTPSTPGWWLTTAMALLGLGIGPTFSVLGMAVMHPFGPAHRGAASATMSFIRELGMTVSITVYGVIERNRFADGLKQLMTSLAGGPGAAGAGSAGPATGVSTGAGAQTGAGNGLVSIPDPRMLLSPELRAHIPESILHRLTDLLTSSITETFAWTLVPALLALALTFGFGRAKWAGFGPAAAARDSVNAGGVGPS